MYLCILFTSNAQGLTNTKFLFKKSENGQISKNGGCHLWNSMELIMRIMNNEVCFYLSSAIIGDWLYQELIERN